MDDLCLDATAGNGLDTLFLAELTKGKGGVHAMDLQQDALTRTCGLLEQHGLKERVVTLSLLSFEDGNGSARKRKRTNQGQSPSTSVIFPRETNPSPPKRRPP